jgi:hypothetical protein
MRELFMLDINQAGCCDPLGFPEDLRAWVEEPKLVRLTLEALETVQSSDVQAAENHALPLGLPRVLLTLLTYGYGIGLLSSDQLEAQIPHDPQLLYLAARACPTGSLLRQFRRHHRGLLLQSLSALLQLVWETHATCGGMEPPAPRKIRLDAASTWPTLFERAAQWRIDQAILADTMALDG